LSWGAAFQQLAIAELKIQEVEKEIAGELQQQHQAKLAQRQAVASAFAQAAQNF
jgi:hypothetical protein